MKKITFLSLAILAALSANAIDKQVYPEIPSSFPEAFSMQVQRYDYRGVDDAGEPMLVNVQPVEILWEPEYMNGSACYGKLTVSNFFSHEWVQEAATVEFTNENNLNFQWSEDATQCTVTSSQWHRQVLNIPMLTANLASMLCWHAPRRALAALTRAIGSTEQVHGMPIMAVRHSTVCLTLLTRPLPSASLGVRLCAKTSMVRPRAM